MMLIILFTVIGVSLCVQILKFALRYWRSYCILLQSNIFRGPRTFPFIGNALLFIGNTGDMFNKLHSTIDKYRSPFRLWMGPQLFFILYEPEHIKQVLTNPASRDKDVSDDVLKECLGEGLLTASASKWQAHRKAIQPLFQTEALRPLVVILAKKAALTADQIGLNEKGKEFDLYDYMMRYTVDSICETTLGVPKDSITNNDSSYVNALICATGILASKLLKPWLKFDCIFNRTSNAPKYYDAIKYLNDFARTVLRKAKNEVGKEIKSNTRNLACLLLRPTEDGYKFTDREILDEILTLGAAGSETTASVLTYSLYILASYPDIQEKVYKEVRKVCGECNSEGSFVNLTLEDLSRLEYLDRVFKETMRFFPASATLTRYIGSEIKLGKYTLPAKCTVMLALYKVHRCEDFWPKADEFNPDRYLPNHPLGPRHPYAFLPFSAGARNCIGMRYATMAAKLCAVTLLSRYTFKTSTPQKANEIQLKLSITLKPVIPITVSVEERIPESN